jgi:hypothetical protein
MKLSVFVLAMIAFSAPAALAKGPDHARACGAVRCVSIHGTAAAALLDWGGQSEFDLLAAPRRVPYYRITLYERGTYTWEFLMHRRFRGCGSPNWTCIRSARSRRPGARSLRKAGRPLRA